MRELYRYLLITVGGPLLIIAILNAGLFVELWKLIKIKTMDSSPPALTAEVRDDLIRIPKLGVEAPLILSRHDPTAPWDDVREDLDNGVSLAPGLSKPGESGTAFITGHSSDYAWRDGQFKTIFALLPTLSSGDQIIIDYQGNRYTYTVTGSRIVHPSEVSAFANRGGKTLTLMTCYPPLTTAKRWLVYAKLSS